MSIGKNGIVASPLFYESNATAGISNPNISYSYKPAKDTNNSCMSGQVIDFTNYVNSSSAVTFHIELDVEYSGFDASSTAGTFAMIFQGSVYKIASSSFVWESNAGFNQALNNQKSLTLLVTENTSGTYHYSTTFTVSTNFLNTYSKQYLGIRTNYSNGSGTIAIKNIKICENKYYTGNTKATIAEDYAAATEIIEM